jgi:prepilin-type N-terminal cleavage/methylation domain-containing protein
MTPRTVSRRKRWDQSHRTGFTLIEVLVALLLFGIVVPVAMNAIDLATHGGSVARHQAEAATLADAKLAELVAQAQADPTLATAGGVNQGDFGPDFPAYRWVLQSAQREYDTAEFSLSVLWQDQGADRNVTVTTLIRTQQSTQVSTQGVTR